MHQNSSSIQQKRAITGKTINLRSVRLDDASFILALRLNPELSANLSQTDPDLGRQVAWIDNCLKDLLQFYFIIEDKSNCAFGTVRIYDLQADSFCWGSWILQPNAPRLVAIESALLVYEFGFYELGFIQSHFDVRKGNTRVLEFHKRLGAKIIGETDLDYLFRYPLESYESVRPRYLKLLA